ncbi:hypothetical protein MBRA1_002810 [Malassezia brasiliensis]|uniref:Carbohydrate kinase PfkB domain-containing protein n=1 Tax=Malassezia brasiliensis TaxID=1821822 RepID=A0AAF0DUU2_9BASI|nr:hypothetical protein MBRA1_002810 [Malassezia brasiliensis]
MTLRACLSVSGGVRAALHEGRPVVALESTIITHGLPRPINYKTAVAAEEAVRKAGAEPATIALLDGKAHVGLTRSQLARIAEAKENVYKASRANLAQTLAQGKGHVGGTTVSGTMALAHLAGIRIFATGGIGGVHRGAESSMDISADLVELGRTPVAVFSSGAKSILDIPRTLEYLETQGVPVMSFHPSGEFPSFYSARSGLHVPSVRDAHDAARIIAYNRALQLQNGLLFGVPIPAEFEKEGAVIQAAVERAVRESVELGIDRQGKLATPWLLRRVAELAQQSVTSNIGLVLNNARVAAECAVALEEVSQSNIQPSGMRISLPAVHSTAKGHVRFSLGGVAQNMASAAQTILADRASALVDDASMLSELVDVQLIKMGPLGVLVVHRCGDQTQVAYAPAHALEASKLVNTTGAGDTFTGAVVAALCEMQTGASPSMEQLLSLVDRGQAAALRTLYSDEAVAPSFT